MPRIGIFIDTLQGSIPASFREKISDYIKKLPEIAFCIEEENLTSPDALSRMGRRLESGGVDGIVIIGGSPKLYEASFQKWKYPFSFNPYLFSVANIREQALWMMPDDGTALERAKTIISKTIRSISHSKPIEAQSLPLPSEVLILGGGITGISIAQELTKSGIHVFLLEKGPHLGGRTLDLRRFYNHPLEVQKWLDERISTLKEDPQVTLLTRTELKHLEGHVGRFQARIQGPDRMETDISASAIVVATGYSVRRETEGIYGHKRVAILSDMEKLLTETQGPVLVWDGKKVDMVTYLLDGVNEDIKIDSIHAIKQALFLQETFQCQVAVLCKDVKVAADGMERLYRKAREKGVLFFKYEEPPKLSIVNGQIQIHVRDTAAIQKRNQWPISILSDLVVVSEAFLPAPETESLSKLLGIHLGNRGFLMQDNPQLLRVRSNRRGIFVAGACRFPQEVSESLIEARAVAQEVVALLSKEAYLYDLTVAEVDPKKCAVCYTCPRLCPHSAITVERYGERNVYAAPGTGGEMKWGAARVDPAACYGCGICVAECPARAITLQHLTDGQIYAQMGLPD
ncbi:MAG TPA: FAD-dependent oxidoreductase [Thermodesulfobacteriota bacterium]|nr:FAD-dependent oxidoreductase [Thermodesulfobacteriota bacterium]